MVQRLGVILIVLFAAVAMNGCSGDKAEVETASSQTHAQEAASNWTPAQKEAMKKAMSDRRSDGGGNGKNK